MKAKKVLLLLSLYTSITLCNINVVASEENIIKIEETLTINNSTDEQLEQLKAIISDNIGIDVKYIDKILSITDGKAVYADKNPDIYKCETLKTDIEPYSINNANTKYRKAEFIECEDKSIERPSPYYAPDAIYSIVYDIKEIMDKRMEMDRQGMSEYYESLMDDAKQDIIFYESVLEYMGVKEESIGEIYKAYEKILYNKEADENIVRVGATKLVLKKEYKEIFKEIGITDTDVLDKIAILMSYDNNIAESDNIENVKDMYTFPYELNKSTRENMMIAAASLCGKVRYVWGGGHSGASYLDGINPVWQMWEDMYADTPTVEVIDDEGNTTEIKGDGFDKCIKPSGTWCPVHGSTGNCWARNKVNSLDEYINARSELFGDTIKSEKYRELLSTVNYDKGVSMHAIDGLDCSGFASWLYNQVTDKYQINSTAVNFTGQNGINSVEFGGKLLPGDTFSWTTHIIVIVGQVKENSKAYVTIEQTPNVLKYGVAYYTGASQSDINYAKEVAAEANCLIGGLRREYEEPHCYCMNNVGKYKVSLEQEMLNETKNNETVESPNIDSNEDNIQLNDSETSVVDDNLTLNLEKPSGDIDLHSKDEEGENLVEKQYFSVGRLNIAFEDEDTIVEPYGKSMSNMNAVEIIQHTINKLPISYLTGYNIYEGDIFDKTLVSSELGLTTETTEVETNP